MITGIKNNIRAEKYLFNMTTLLYVRRNQISRYLFYVCTALLLDIELCIMDTILLE